MAVASKRQSENTGWVLLARTAQQVDLDAQVRALNDIQRLPGFISGPKTLKTTTWLRRFTASLSTVLTQFSAKLRTALPNGFGPRKKTGGIIDEKGAHRRAGGETL
jgi:hypothetical protein